MADTNPSFSLQSSDAAAEIRAERDASNAAIARRDAKGTVANMLPGYRGTWAQSQMHSSREAVYAARTASGWRINSEAFVALAHRDDSDD
jgi:hypothetical protein